MPGHFACWVLLAELLFCAPVCPLPSLHFPHSQLHGGSLINAEAEEELEEELEDELEDDEDERDEDELEEEELDELLDDDDAIAQSPAKI